MELDELVMLGACALLAAEVKSEGFTIAEKRIGSAIQLSYKVWLRLVAQKEKGGC